jgi:hypothetical protein
MSKRHYNAGKSTTGFLAHCFASAVLVLLKYTPSRQQPWFLASGTGNLKSLFKANTAFIVAHKGLG